MQHKSETDVLFLAAFRFGPIWKRLFFFYLLCRQQETVHRTLTLETAKKVIQKSGDNRLRRNELKWYRGTIYNSCSWLWCMIIMTPCYGYGSLITPGTGVPKPPQFQHLATTWTVIRGISSVQLLPVPLLNVSNKPVANYNQTISASNGLTRNSKNFRKCLSAVKKMLATPLKPVSKQQTSDRYDSMLLLISLNNQTGPLLQPSS